MISAAKTMYSQVGQKRMTTDHSQWPGALAHVRRIGSDRVLLLPVGYIDHRVERLAVDIAQAHLLDVRHAGHDDRHLAHPLAPFEQDADVATLEQDDEGADQTGNLRGLDARRSWRRNRAGRRRARKGRARAAVAERQSLQNRSLREGLFGDARARIFESGEQRIVNVCRPASAPAGSSMKSLRGCSTCYHDPLERGSSGVPTHCRAAYFWLRGGIEYAGLEEFEKLAGRTVAFSSSGRCGALTSRVFSSVPISASSS